MTDNERKKVFIEGYLKAYEDMREGIDRVLAAIENDLEKNDSEQTGEKKC